MAPEVALLLLRNLWLERPMENPSRSAVRVANWGATSRQTFTALTGPPSARAFWSSPLSSWAKILKAPVAFDTACSFVNRVGPGLPTPACAEAEAVGDEEDELAGWTEQPLRNTNQKNPATRGGLKKTLTTHPHFDAHLAQPLRNLQSWSASRSRFSNVEMLI